MKSFLLFTIGLFVMAAGSLAVYDINKSADYDKYEKAWDAYCNAEGDISMQSTKIPKVDYSSSLVKRAAKKLDTVAPVTFFMYHQVTNNLNLRKAKDESFPWELYAEILNLDKFSRNKKYGMKKTYVDGELVSEEFDEETLKKKFAYQYYIPGQQTPQGVKGNTHAFLTYLCAEFRDRPTMIEEKLDWVANMLKLPLGEQAKIEPSKDIKNIWAHVNAESYNPYIQFSRQAYNAKERALGGVDQDYLDKGISEVTKPVPAYTVCETKYIFTEYVSQGKIFPGWDEFKQGYDAYAANSNYCSQDDLDYYYDFRGDSNIKPNSPESNGMIWQGNTVQSFCVRDASGTVTVNPKVKSYVESTPGAEAFITQSDCQKYFEKPFSNRWNAARGGLATWLLRDKKYDAQFTADSVKTWMIPTWSPENFPIGMRPTQGADAGKDFVGLQGQFLDEWEANYQKYWVLDDIGANEIFKIGSPDMNLKMAFERLRDTVNRHTDWYASGYDDTFGADPSARIGRKFDAFYSPYVASSYEMSESDQFAQPGVTVQAPIDDRKHMMFVFKVHKDNWYNTDSLKAGQPVNFEKHWIDETTFGTNSLANKERAWDKMGTALEGEFETILYLHNLKRNGTVIDDQLGQTHKVGEE